MAIELEDNNPLEGLVLGGSNGVFPRSTDGFIIGGPFNNPLGLNQNINLPLEQSRTEPLDITKIGSTSTKTAQAEINIRKPKAQAEINIRKPKIPTSPPPEPSSFIGQIPFFLNAILSTPAGALPKGPLWVLAFEFDDNIRNTIKSVKDYEPRMPEPWEISDALDVITSRMYQEEKGCMLAQNVTVPGEALNYSQEGIDYNGFITGGVGKGRTNFDPLNISFLNTNVSFLENVIRPWVVMTGHLGMIARPDSQKYRCNMTIYRLGIDRVDRPPFVAQQFNYFGVCPINIFAEEYSYSAEGVQPTKSAQFAYQWYTTSSNKNIFNVPGYEAVRVGFGGADVRRATPA